MDAKPFKDKSLSVLDCDSMLVVLEGSVRSAKTLTSLALFYKRILLSRDSVFLMSGNTLGSISRNCIQGDYGFIALTGGKAQAKTDTDGSKFLELGNKKIYYCGSDNQASFKKIRGLSIGGWYADEINLHDWNFIETAEARSFAAIDRFEIWTLNPDTPTARIYKDRIDRYEQGPQYHWFHFDLDDNPALTEERKKELKAQYTGVFYDRYILGRRVRAEGGCFPSFKRNKPGEIGNVLYEYPQNIRMVTFGIDFGGNKSATTFVCTGHYFRDRKPCIVALDYKRLRHDQGNIGPKELNEAWFAFQRDCRARWPADRAFADSAEQVLIKGLNQIPQSMRVENAMKRPIMQRIRAGNILFAQGRAHIMGQLEGLIEAIENAVYDEKSLEDKRLDDGTSDIDSLDAWEYSWERHITDLVEGVNA